MVRNTALIAILLAALSTGVYWLTHRPTPEETTLKNFFSEFKEGMYTDAQAYTLADNFYRMASDTTVHDANNNEYLIGDYFPPSRAFALQMAVETYVKPHIAKWKYLGMDTQKLDENNSIVTFRLDLGVRDFTRGEVLGTVHTGRVEGKAFMRNDSGESKIEKFDLHIFSDDDLALEPYLEQAN